MLYILRKIYIIFCIYANLHACSHNTSVDCADGDPIISHISFRQIAFLHLTIYHPPISKSMHMYVLSFVMAALRLSGQLPVQLFPTVLL